MILYLSDYIVQNFNTSTPDIYDLIFLIFSNLLISYYMMVFPNADSQIRITAAGRSQKNKKTDLSSAADDSDHISGVHCHNSIKLLNLFTNFN